MLIVQFESGKFKIISWE